MEKVFAKKGEDRRLGAFFSNLRKCRMEDTGEAKKTTEKTTMSWQEYERRKARKHRARHIGGPGREDYLRGDVKGEIKHMKRRMTKREVMRAVRKGITEIDTLGGYTKPAIEYILRYRPDVRLFHRGRHVV